jgi:hypothetical protein
VFRDGKRRGVPEWAEGGSCHTVPGGPGQIKPGSHATQCRSRGSPLWIVEP